MALWNCSLKPFSDRWNPLIWVIRKYLFMVCQMVGSIYSIKFYVTSGKRADILNRNSKYPYKKGNHCIDQYNTLLCRGNANINKENIEIIMKTFNNEKTFPINSKQLIKKLFITSFKDENIFLGKQNSCIRNIALCLQRFFKYFRK